MEYEPSASTSHESCEGGSEQIPTTVSAKKFIFRSKKRLMPFSGRNPDEPFRRFFVLETSNTNLSDMALVDDENYDNLVVIIPERMQASYGLYVWPCAPILAWYLYEHREFIHGKKVLELGAGTALPGIVAAFCGASKVILTDSARLPHCLQQCKKSIESNPHLPVAACNIQILGLTWGLFISNLTKLKGQVDLIIGSDCFYDPSVFEDLLATVSNILENNPAAKFLTTYQERSSDWSIVTLLNKWNLQCKHIPLNDLANSCEIDLLQLMQDHTIHLLEIQLKSS